MSGGTGFVVSNSLTDAQTAACIEFIKYMTSEEIANKIIAFGIGMAPNTNVDYATLMDSVDAPEAKLLVSACQLCMAADYQALGLGNEFGDFDRRKLISMQTGEGGGTPPSLYRKERMTHHEGWNS